MQRIALPGDGFDERRFTTSVGAENGDVLADADPKHEVVEGDFLAAHDGNALEVEEGRSEGQEGQNNRRREGHEAIRLSFRPSLILPPGNRPGPSRVPYLDSRRLVELYSPL